MRQLRLIIAGLLVLGPLTANAVPITFSFDSGDNGLNTIIKTVDGLTMTFDNPRLADDTPEPFRFFDGGLFWGSGTGNNSPYLADITFSAAVRLVSYDITNIETGESFDLVQGGVSSLGNSVSTLGAGFSFTNTVSVFAAGTIIDFIGDTTFDGEGFSIQNFTVEVVQVPEPAILALLGIGFFGLGMARRKNG